MNDQDGGTPVPTFRVGDILVPTDPRTQYRYLVIGLNEPYIYIKNLTTNIEFRTQPEFYRLHTKLDKVLE